MPTFNLGPYFVKIHYTVGTHPHTMTLPFRIKDDFAGVGIMPTVRDFEGNDADLSVFLDDFVDTLKKFYSSTSAFSSWDAYHVASANSIPEWIYSGGFTTATGTSTGAAVVASQAVITFRTGLGNRFKLYLMEPAIGPNEVTSADALMNDVAWGPIMDMIIRYPFHTIVGRDGARIVAPIRAITKINDVLRRKYLVN